MPAGGSPLCYVVIGFAASFSLACGSGEIPVVSEDFSREGVGTIKIVQDDWGATPLRG